MWAHWLMTVFGSVLRHSSLQAAAVALFMGTVPKRVRVSVYLMFWRVLACRMWASMVRVESVLCVVIIYSRYTRLVACRLWHESVMCVEFLVSAFECLLRLGLPYEVRVVSLRFGRDFARVT